VKLKKLLGLTGKLHEVRRQQGKRKKASSLKHFKTKFNSCNCLPKDTGDIAEDDINFDDDDNGEMELKVLSSEF
jgi:hypothetical protein